MFIQRKLENIKTFNILNLFTNSSFYYLYLAEAYPKVHLSEIYGIPESNLQNTIEILLLENYSLTIRHQIEYPEYYLLAIINKFSEVMIEFNGDSTKKNDRDSFEEKFEKKIINEEVSSLVLQYRQSVNSIKKTFALKDYIEDNLFPNEDIFKFGELFYYSLEPSWDSMKQSLENIEKKDEFIALYVFLERYEDLKNLVYLCPIVFFCREMIKECSFRISRADAKNKTIGMFLEDNRHLNIYYNEFVKAWEKLDIKLSFECETLEKYEITKDLPLGCFLLENDINSYSKNIVAAIKSLCMLQNKIASLLPNNKNKEEKLSIMNLYKEDILYISPEILELIVKKNTINSFEYGKEKIIYYDYKHIYNNFERCLSKFKLLDNENFEQIQYQYELLYSRNKYAGIINEIRNRIKEIPLDDNEIRFIENFMQKKSEEYKVDIDELWNQVYLWLERAILNIKDSNNKNDDSIQNYDDVNLYFKKNFKVYKVFSNFKVGQFIEIFEFVEMKIYPTVLKFIEDEYKIELNDKNSIMNSIKEFCARVIKEFSIETLIECHKVLKRIILRLLTANTDNNFEFFTYFEYGTYWSYEFLGSCEKVAEFFPKKFYFKHAIEIEKLFEIEVQKLKNNS